jgi:hypothetical protein
VIAWSQRLGAPRVAAAAVALVVLLVLGAFGRDVLSGGSFRGGAWAAAAVLLGMGLLGLLYAWRLGASGPPD